MQICQKRARPAWWKSTLVGIVFSTLCLAEAACTTPQPADDPPPKEFTLAPGDKIQVEVYDHQEFSGPFLLDNSGSISIPKAGVIPLQGKTLREAETSISAGLKSELNNPKVSVNILEYRPIYVDGQVVQPGQYPFMSGMRVLNAISLAHGFNYRADKSRIEVVRANDPTATPQPVNEGTLLEPGDTVRVLESWF